MAGATTFAFRAMDMAGAATAGELEADSKAQVSEQLRQRGLIVLDVSEKSQPLKLEELLRPAGRASTCGSWRSSRASSRPWSPPGCR